MTKNICHFFIVYALSSHLAPVMATVRDHHDIFNRKCEEKGETVSAVFMKSESTSLTDVMKITLALPSNAKNAENSSQNRTFLIETKSFEAWKLIVGEHYRVVYLKNTLCSLDAV